MTDTESDREFVTRIRYRAESGVHQLFSLAEWDRLLTLAETGAGIERAEEAKAAG